jgi:NADH:ubiquinone oxidoreductase subunit 2 (subunit N)
MLLLNSSVLSAAYYIRLIRFIFFVSTRENKVSFKTDIKLDKSFYILLVFLFALNLFIIFYHN